MALLPLALLPLALLPMALLPLQNPPRELGRQVPQREHCHQYVRSSGCHLVMVTGE